AIMPYPAHLETRGLLRDGRPFTIRPIQAEDAERLQRFVRTLSSQSRYFRFISTLNELTPRMLVRYTQIDYDRELALVAVIPRTADATAFDGAGEHAGAAESTEAADDEIIIGVVRYLLNPDRRSCEFAIAIADRFHGKGLGTTLMNAIVDAARSKGLQRIEGFVLASNAAMMQLMRAPGFTIETDPHAPAPR